MFSEGVLKWNTNAVFGFLRWLPLIRVRFRQVNIGRGKGVRVRREEKTGRDESYPSRGQSLAVRVWAHGQGTVESHTSICSNVSALEEERERERV